MGLYINPPNQTKEQWLKEKGTRLDIKPVLHQLIKEDRLPVVLVSNGSFTAAAVAFDEWELRDFTDPKDYRPKTYYSVPISDLREVCSDFEVYYTPL